MDIQEQGQIIPTNYVDIKKDGPISHISSPKIDLASNKPPLELVIEVEKHATAVDVGTVLHMIKINEPSPRYQRMLEEARALKQLPERERPRKLVELLRSNVQYAYPSKIKELEVNDPPLAERIKQILVLRADDIDEPLPLSEIIETGFGVCKHLSVAMLPLAEVAGLKGALCASHSGRIKNVIRKDNGQPLFKLYDVGNTTDPHVWVELQISNGEWIPADPATQLVGDNLESLTTFEEANYRAIPGYININDLPENVSWSDQDPSLQFLPGERTHRGVLKINSEPTPIIELFPSGALVSRETQTTYSGPLNLQISSIPSSYSCSASILDIRKIDQ